MASRKTIDPETLGLKKFDALARYCAGHRGTITKIVHELNRSLARPVDRKTVELWLHRNPEIRMSPRFGMALLLVRAAKKVTGLKLPL